MAPRVLLLNPPVDVFAHKLSRGSMPLGVCYVGTFLKAKGYEVSVLDTLIEAEHKTKLQRDDMVRLGLTLEHIEESVRKIRPDIVGISCNSHAAFKPTLDLAAMLKTRAGIRHVVAGGCYASVVPERIMASAFIDYLVIGEGEQTAGQLLDALSGQRPVDLPRLDGLAWRAQSGQVKINPKTRFIPPEEFITPDRDLLPVEKYIKLNRPHGFLTKGRRVLEMLTSRGCNATCTFCSAILLQGKFRGRSAAAVVEELQLLKEKYHIDEVQFLDDNLTMDRERAKKVFQLMIDRSLRLSWCVPNGIALYALDDELIKLMEQSGCYRVSLAIESGSQRVLSRIMKKPLSLEKIYPLVKTFRKYGISLEAFLIVGMPGETFQDMQQTFDFVFKLGIFRAHFNYAMPIPSTPLYAEYRRLKKDADRDIDQEYYFDFRIPVISTPEWTHEELRRFVSRQILRLYLRYAFRRPFMFIAEMTRLICNPKAFYELMRYYRAQIFKR